MAHVNPITESFSLDSAYISTSTSKKVAEGFPKNPQSKAFLYEIMPHSNAVDVVPALKKAVRRKQLCAEDFTMFSSEKEMAIPHQIRPQDIKGAWEVNITQRTYDAGTAFEEKIHVRSTKEPYIPNPYFPPTQFLSRARTVGRGLTLTGAAIDGASLYKTYETSQTSGDYQPFFQEGARILGGWSGAAVTGMTFARAGATLCAPLGPLGGASCAVVAGAVGSVLGYTGGGMAGSAIVSGELISSAHASEERVALPSLPFSTKIAPSAPPVHDKDPSLMQQSTHHPVLKKRPTAFAQQSLFFESSKPPLHEKTSEEKQQSEQVHLDTKITENSVPESNSIPLETDDQPELVDALGNYDAAMQEVYNTAKMISSGTPTQTASQSFSDALTFAGEMSAAASGLCVIFNKPELGAQISAVSKAIIGSGMQLGGLAGIGPLAGLATPWTAVIAGIDMVAQVVQAFKRTQSLDETLFRQLAPLSQLMQQMQSETKLGIHQIKSMLTDQEFSSWVEFLMIGDDSTDTKDQLIKIALTLEEQFTKLDTMMRHAVQGIQDLSTQVYETETLRITQEISSELLAYLLKTETMHLDGNDFSKERTKFHQLITGQARWPQVTGRTDLGAESGSKHVARWTISLLNQESDYLINTLRANAQPMLRQLHGSDIPSLVNPNLWQTVMLCLLHLYEDKYPLFSEKTAFFEAISKSEVDLLKEGMDYGKKVRDFKLLMKHPEFFGSLFENLETALTVFETKLQSIYTDFEKKTRVECQKNATSISGTLRHQLHKKFLKQAVPITIYGDWFKPRVHGRHGWNDAVNGNGAQNELAKTAHIQEYLIQANTQVQATKKIHSEHIEQRDQSNDFLDYKTTSEWFNKVMIPTSASDKTRASYLEPEQSGDLILPAPDRMPRLSERLQSTLEQAIWLGLGQIHYRYRMESIQDGRGKGLPDPMSLSVTVYFKRMDQDNPSMNKEYLLATYRQFYSPNNHHTQFYQPQERLWWHWCGGKIPITLAYNPDMKPEGNEYAEWKNYSSYPGACSGMVWHVSTFYPKLFNHSPEVKSLKLGQLTPYEHEGAAELIEAMVSEKTGQFRRAFTEKIEFELDGLLSQEVTTLTAASNWLKAYIQFGFKDIYHDTFRELFSIDWLLSKEHIHLYCTHIKEGQEFVTERAHIFSKLSQLKHDLALLKQKVIRSCDVYANSSMDRKLDSMLNFLNDCCVAYSKTMQVMNSQIGVPRSEDPVEIAKRQTSLASLSTHMLRLALETTAGILSPEEQKKYAENLAQALEGDSEIMRLMASVNLSSKPGGGAAAEKTQHTSVANHPYTLFALTSQHSVNELSDEETKTSCCYTERDHKVSF